MYFPSIKHIIAHSPLLFLSSGSGNAVRENRKNHAGDRGSRSRSPGSDASRLESILAGKERRRRRRSSKQEEGGRGDRKGIVAQGYGVATKEESSGSRRVHRPNDGKQKALAQPRASSRNRQVRLFVIGMCYLFFIPVLLLCATFTCALFWIGN